MLDTHFTSLLCTNGLNPNPSPFLGTASKPQGYTLLLLDSLPVSMNIEPLALNKIILRGGVHSASSSFPFTFSSILKSHERSDAPMVVWEYLFEPLWTGKIRIPHLSNLSQMLYSRMKCSAVTSDLFSTVCPSANP